MVNETHSSINAVNTQRRRRVIVTPIVVGVVLIAAAFAGWAYLAGRADRAALLLLRSANPETRKMGAWLTAQEEAPRAVEHIDEALSRPFRDSASGPTEPDPTVRESFIYALGRSEDPRFFDTAASVLRDDPDPYVRQAAWLAAARLDPVRFRELASRAGPRNDPWDRIGFACAWLEIGDTRGVDELLHWAAAGTSEQKRVAAIALGRGVGPLLEAVGHWPLEATVQEGESWPPEFVEEIARRCAPLDLQVIADEQLPHKDRVAAIRRNVGRLYHTQERIADVLLGSDD